MHVVGWHSVSRRSGGSQASETSDVESVMMAIQADVRGRLHAGTESRNDRGLGVTWIACDMHSENGCVSEYFLLALYHLQILLRLQQMSRRVCIFRPSLCFIVF
jgi:hypothetical protein